MVMNELGESIALNGTWQCQLGPLGEWADITVPGCWEAQGYSKYTDGPARYQYRVTIPANWTGQRILLECGAVSYACQVFCNGMPVGQHVGLWTPFAVDLSPAARPGEENLLELEIDKPGGRYPTRSSLAGFLPDVATTFGGIWQPIGLRAVTCALMDAQMRTEYDSRTVQVKAQLATFNRDLHRPFWKLAAFQQGHLIKEAKLPLSPNHRLDATLSLPEAQPWSPDTPARYDIQLTLYSDDQPVARVTRRVGFRKLHTSGPAATQLLLNNQPYMVRGILSWGWEPERIAPTYTVEQARAEMRKVRELGFNLVKLCLVIPNPTYFDVADEEGMLIWVELPLWLPEVNDQLRAQAPQEYAEMAQMLAHHPSIVLYSLGCEMNQSVDRHFLEQLNRAVRLRVQDVLLCDNSGSGESYGGLDIDFADFTDYHPYYDLQFFEPLLDHWRRDWQTPRPWIFGEFCDSDTFRDQTEIIRANGNSRPWWLTRDNPVTVWRSEAQAALEWEKRLEAAAPGFPLDEIVAVSYRQAYTIRKYTLESLRKRRAMGGYIITGLRDTPISTSGVWDDFGRPKWSGEAFVQINGEAILTLDVVRRRRWLHGGDRPDRLDLYNYWSGDPARWYVILHNTGPGFPTGSQFTWKFTDPSGSRIASGETSLAQPCLPGDPQQISAIQVQLPQVHLPKQFHLRVELSTGDRMVNNEWSVWVYSRLHALPPGLAIFDPSGLLVDFSDLLKSTPQIQPEAAFDNVKLLLATSLSPRLWQAIAAGARVLLLQQGENPLPVRHCPFWREAVKLFPDHPLWAQFPQQGFTDMQFFGLASDLAFDTVRLVEALPQPTVLRPILRRLDAREFHMSEYLFEARIGSGILLGCALRLQGGLGAQPYGWQRNVAGGALLHALLRYLESSF